MEDHPPYGSDFLRFEITTVQDPTGRWQPFVARIGMIGDPIFLPDAENPFALPTMPSRILAEELSCLLVWSHLDEIRIKEVFCGTWREVDPLE